MSRTMTPRQRKIRAALASGLVLGIGAVITLAAWNDSVWGESEFGSDRWNIQGDFGSGWQEHATAGTAGSFTFEIPLAQNLTPGDVVSAPVSLRVGPDTSELNASVTLQPSGNTSELASALRLTVRESAVCDGSGVVPAGWPSDGVLSSAGGATPITLEGDSTPREFCFYVELPTNTPPLTTDATGPVLWEFQATSVAP